MSALQGDSEGDAVCGVANLTNGIVLVGFFWTKAQTTATVTVFRVVMAFILKKWDLKFCWHKFAEDNFIVFIRLDIKYL